MAPLTVSRCKRKGAARRGSSSCSRNMPRSERRASHGLYLFSFAGYGSHLFYVGHGSHVFVLRDRSRSFLWATARACTFCLMANEHRRKFEQSQHFNHYADRAWHQARLGVQCEHPWPMPTSGTSSGHRVHILAHIIFRFRTETRLRHRFCPLVGVSAGAAVVWLFDAGCQHRAQTLAARAVKHIAAPWWYSEGPRVVPRSRDGYVPHFEAS